MTLETALAENTATMKELIAALARLGNPAAASPVNEAPKPEKAATPSTGTTRESPVSSAPSATGEARALTYDADVKPKAIALSKKSMDAFKEVLGNFNIAKFPDAKPEQYAGIVQALDEKLAA